MAPPPESPPLLVGSTSALTANRIPEAARVVANAFLHYPLYMHIFATEQTTAARLRALTWLFEKNITMRFDSSATVQRYAAATYSPSGGGVGGGEGAMVCFFMIERPGSADISMWQMIRSGIMRALFSFGRVAVLRLLHVKNWYEEKEKKVAETVFAATPYCVLERMTVTPELQGKGIGSRCLSSALATEAASGRGVLLCTQNKRNVKFYTRLGFRTVYEEDYIPADGSICVPNWFMVKEAPPAAEEEEEEEEKSLASTQHVGVVTPAPYTIRTAGAYFLPRLAVYTLISVLFGDLASRLAFDPSVNVARSTRSTYWQAAGGGATPTTLPIPDVVHSRIDITALNINLLNSTNPWYGITDKCLILVLMGMLWVLISIAQRVSLRAAVELCLEWMWQHAMLLIMRGILVNVTTIPSPVVACQNALHPPTAFGVPVHCNDLMFSGHTATYVLCFMFVYHVYGGWKSWATICCGAATALFGFISTAVRDHYTSDVLVAAFLAVWMSLARADRVHNILALKN